MIYENEPRMGRKPTIQQPNHSTILDVGYFLYSRSFKANTNLLFLNYKKITSVCRKFIHVGNQEDINNTKQ
jgi:hypothetical protein